MNVQQRAFIKSMVGNPIDQQFDHFIRDANLDALLNGFEAGIQAAWSQFVQQKKMIYPSFTKSERFRKMQFPDCGDNIQDIHLLPQEESPLKQGSKIFLTPHYPQAHAFVIAASISSHSESQQPLIPTASALPAATPPTLASEVLTTTKNTAPNAQGTSPKPPSPSSLTAPIIGTPLDLSSGPKPLKTPQTYVVHFTISNARQNKPFDCKIASNSDILGLRLVDVVLPKNSGLKFDRENWRINGIPLISGEFILGLRYAFLNEPTQISHTTGLTLVINADPKTLWKDIPSDITAPFWKEDSASTMVLGKQARIVAARKRGRSHAHKGTCCDDDYAAQYDDENGWYLAVVADGAGSSKFSRRGSQVATRTVANYMKEVFADERGSSLIESIEAFAKLSACPETSSDKLVQAQKKLQGSLYTTLGFSAHTTVCELQSEMNAQKDFITSIKDLSTTLLIGIARKVGSQWFCAAYWVGDGAIAVYRRNHSVHLLGVPDSGEFSGQTHFLDANQVSKDALSRRLRFEIVDDMTAFMLMTDGVSDTKFSSDVAMGQVEDWDRLWDELEADVRLSADKNGVETRLLDWLNFWAKGEYDDRTMAIIY